MSEEMKIDRTEYIKRLKFDFDRFEYLMRDFEKHFVNKDRRANHQMLALDLTQLVNETVTYIDGDQVFDVSALSKCIPDNQHDRELYKDLIELVYQHFQGSPASKYTLIKFRTAITVMLSLSGF